MRRIQFSAWMPAVMTGILVAVGAVAWAAKAAAADKTLVSWVRLANTTQRGGSALTVQCGEQFDGIVFGEIAPGTWMAGSENYVRTQRNQEACATEKADDNTFIQMAIVYRGNRITVYRDATAYASHESANIDLLGSKDSMVVFGIRHDGARSGQLEGAVQDARIFDHALSVEDLKSLEPGKESAIKPLAWWNFSDGQGTDRMGRFPVNSFEGSATIKGGCLDLGKTGQMIAATRKFDRAAREERWYAKWSADSTRPIYHLLSAESAGHVADPNFAIFWKGQYHLFYISPSGYSHVSSTDLLHWHWHRNLAGPLCSGGIFVNKDGRPTLISTSAWTGGKLSLFTALDDELDAWSEPVLIEMQARTGQDTSMMSCWDPDIWQEGGTTYALQGVYPLSVKKEVTLLKSMDQKQWTFVGPFMNGEMPDVQRSAEVERKNEDISCPSFFKIGDKWMLLCISHIRGCRYYIGEWKDEKFTPELHGRMNWALSEGMNEGDHGGEFFAPESVLTPDGRRVMWAWIFAMSRKHYGPSWKEAMSLPRELSLPKDGILRIKPLRELEHLRRDPMVQTNVLVENGKPCRLEKMGGDTIELMATIKPVSAEACGMRVLCDKENGKGIDVMVELGKKCIRLGSTTAPFDLMPGESIQLRVFVDRSIVEIFVNDRQAVVKQHAYEPEHVGVCLLSSGGDCVAESVQRWRVDSIYTPP